MRPPRRPASANQRPRSGPSVTLPGRHCVCTARSPHVLIAASAGRVLITPPPPPLPPPPGGGFRGGRRQAQAPITAASRPCAPPAASHPRAPSHRTPPPPLFPVPSSRRCLRWLTHAHARRPRSAPPAAGAGASTHARRPGHPRARTRAPAAPGPRHLCTPHAGAGVPQRSPSLPLHTHPPAPLPPHPAASGHDRREPPQARPLFAPRPESPRPRRGAACQGDSGLSRPAACRGDSGRGDSGQGAKGADTPPRVAPTPARRGASCMRPGPPLPFHLASLRPRPTTGGAPARRLNLMRP